MTTGIATTGTAAAPPGLLLREAGPLDAPELHRLFGRCSAVTRYDRFHGHVRQIPAAYLAEALTADPCLHDALVVQRAEGPELVALGSGRRVVGAGGPAVDIGLLVEDAAQRRGLGTLLLTTLAERARARGIGVLRCDLLAGHERLIGVLRRTLGPVETRHEDGVVSARVRLA